MSDHLEVVAVDGGDEVLLRGWHRAYDEGARHGLEDVASPWSLEEVRVRLTEPAVRQSTHLWAGVADGEVVAAAEVRLLLLDNLEHAYVDVQVRPDRRRRGYGAALLAHVEGFARSEGRSTVLAESLWPISAPADGRGEPGPEMLRRHGYSLALVDVQRDLALPVPTATLGALAAEAAPHHAAYTLRSFVGPVPEDLVHGWAELVGSLAVEAPMGELVMEAESADVDALRADERVIEQQARTKYNTAAIDAQGEVVGYTDIATSAHDPGRGYQWGTLVRRADRGHRLGLALKVANLRLLQERDPGTIRLTTYNAEVNDHMIAVNQTLGFVPVARLGEFSKTLA